jgi:superfamily II RNA helicase
VQSGRRAWYTSPLKALTNSKYQEFSDEFGAERVGILTGDRKENSDAALVVGTTEIYRNQLFDSLRGGNEVAADLVVIDEAHYLADEDRGHVWEEALILTPPRIRLLLLSATIGNAAEFSSWLEEVRGVECTVISGPPHRPVALRSAVLLPDKRLLPLLNEHGKLNPEIAQMIERSNDRTVSGTYRRPNDRIFGRTNDRSAMIALRLAQRGKDAAEFLATFNDFLVRAVSNGRRLMGNEKAKDAGCHGM